MRRRCLTAFDRGRGIELSQIDSRALTSACPRGKRTEVDRRGVTSDAPFIIRQGTGAQVAAVDVLVALLGPVVISLWGIARRGKLAEPVQRTQS
jgi:hypothetical protein